MDRVVTVTTADSDAGMRFIAAVEEIRTNEGTEANSKRVAFDCEGVDLSRLGTVEIVSLAFSKDEIFLVDVGGSTPDPSVLRALKDLLEDSEVTKIIHDCRMDSDALFHHHGILLANIHDTSCFHTEISFREDTNLNDVLSYNGLRVNDSRDSSVYKRNPRFWATRPLTPRMIDWASSDIDQLFIVATNQLKAISASKLSVAEAKSAANIYAARNMKVESDLYVSNPGRFIGKRGCNLRKLQRRTRTLIYQKGKSSRGWFVYYNNRKDLSDVIFAMEESDFYY